MMSVSPQILYADIYEFHVHDVVNDNINMYLYHRTAVFYVCGVGIVLVNRSSLVVIKFYPHNIGYNLTVYHVCTKYEDLIEKFSRKKTSTMFFC